jgi:hypothetical protein
MYPIRRNYPAERPEVFYKSMHTAMGKTPAGFVWVLAFLLLISAGITYRVFASRLRVIVGTTVTLPVPLSALPVQIGDWVGQDVPIPPNIQRVAGNDASLNRLYKNELNNQWANLYIAYTARPRTMLGHRPQVCYVAGGWVHDSTQQTKVTSSTGRELPCLIHRFHRPAPDHGETVVLNFYIVNGQITSDERVFSGVGWRTPNIAGDLARYVAQVQMSSVLENSVRKATKDMTELILDFLPDKDGRVRATEFQNTISSISK